LDSCSRRAGCSKKSETWRRTCQVFHCQTDATAVNDAPTIAALRRDDLSDDVFAIHAFPDRDADWIYADRVSLARCPLLFPARNSKNPLKRNAALTRSAPLNPM
jgi:hypothetical protein